MDSPQTSQSSATSSYDSSIPLVSGSSSLDSRGEQMSPIWLQIAQDVTTGSQKVDKRKMLEYILVECTDKPHESFDESSKMKLLDDCLMKVIPICDGDRTLAKGLEVIESRRVQDSLKAYANVRDTKKSLYPHFVTAANIALLFLQELDIEHLRRADTCRAVYFHVNDPTVMEQTHHGHTFEHTPGVLLVSNFDIPGLGDSVENLLALTTKPPKDAFDWRCVRTFVEFRRSTKKMELPPPSYARQLEQEKAEAMDSQSRESNSDPDSPPQSTPKHEHLIGRDMRVNVQAGFYAAELLSSHIGRLHAFGLIVVGDMLYLWRYDRQGPIQCSGLNIIKDLPLFLVLLLAMQRFKNQDWGLNPELDPRFGLSKHAVGSYPVPEYLRKLAGR